MLLFRLKRIYTFAPANTIIFARLGGVGANKRRECKRKYDTSIVFLLFLPVMIIDWNWKVSDRRRNMPEEWCMCMFRHSLPNVSLCTLLTETHWSICDACSYSCSTWTKHTREVVLIFDISIIIIGFVCLFDSHCYRMAHKYLCIMTFFYFYFCTFQFYGMHLLSVCVCAVCVLSIVYGCRH